MAGHIPLRALSCALLACTALTTPALAQDAMSEGMPLPRQELDLNGVNPANGSVIIYQPLLSIGPAGPGGLRYVLGHGTAAGAGGSNFTYVLTGDAATSVSLSVGLRSINFTNIGGVLKPDDGSGVTLTFNGSNQYTLTLEDGTVVLFTYFGIYDTYKARGTSLTYPTGEKITLAYNTITWCTTLDDQCPSYGHAVRLQSISSSVGYQLHYTYAKDDIQAPLEANSWKRLVSIKALNTTVDPCDPYAGTCTYSQAWPTASFNTSGGVTDAAGNLWSFTNSTTQFTMKRPSASTANFVANLDANYRVSSIVKDGQTWSYGFTPGTGTMTMVRTDPLNHNSTIVSDTNVGLPTSVTDELNHVTTRHYTNNQLDKITYPEGNYVTYAYDGRGNVQTVTQVPKSGTGLPNVVTSATYAASCVDASCNEPLTTTDARGNVTTYQYNSDGTLKSATSPAVGGIAPKVNYTYQSITLPDSSSVTKLQTVWQCQTTSSCTSTSSDATKATYNWSSQEIQTNIIRASGSGSPSATTTFGHDSIGNITSVDGPLSGTADTTVIRYDLMRRKVGTSSPDPDGAGTNMKMRAVRYTYNVDGNLSKVERGTVSSASDTDWASMSVLETTTVAFDATTGRPKTYSIAGSDGVTQALTQVSYDADLRPQCSAVRMNPGAFTSLPADACTLGTQGTNGPDRITQVVYDNAGRVTQVQTAVGVTGVARTERTLTYSNNGLVTSLKDANNNLTTYQYDGHDRLSKTTYPSTDYEQLTYENTSSNTRTSGTVASRRLRDGTSIAFSYDALNRVTLKNLPGTEPDVTYGYDNLGRLTSASQTGNPLSFTYDALSRNLTQVGPQGTVSFQYDLAGNRTLVTYPVKSGESALSVNYDYLLTGEVQKIRENGATTGVGVLATYAYDDLGNRTSLTYGSSAVQTYAYDPVSRLTTLTTDFSGSTNDLTIGGTATPITYNPASQILSAPRTKDTYSYAYTNASHTFGINALNQYISNNDGTTTKTLTYDTKGNLTSDGDGHSYCYSSENLLIGSGGTCTSPTVSLTYDPFLRLYQVAGTTTTRFAYDGLHMVADYDQTNALQHRYVFGPGADAPIVEYAGTGTTNRTFLSADERGSIIARSNNSGAFGSANTYDEYGISGSGNAGLFQYTGQALIGQLGMYYYKARIYSPTLGRFLQTDPIGYADGANLYAGMHNDPINGTDPLGLEDLNYGCTGTRIQSASCVANQNLGVGNSGSTSGVWGDVGLGDDGSSQGGATGGGSGGAIYTGGPCNNQPTCTPSIGPMDPGVQASVNAWGGYYLDYVWMASGNLPLVDVFSDSSGLNESECSGRLTRSCSIQLAEDAPDKLPPRTCYTENGVQICSRQQTKSERCLGDAQLGRISTYSGSGAWLLGLIRNHPGVVVLGGFLTVLGLDAQIDSEVAGCS
jgi:RHS repeat-associated protein